MYVTRKPFFTILTVNNVNICFWSNLVICFIDYVPDCFGLPSGDLNAWFKKNCQLGLILS